MTERNDAENLSERNDAENLGKLSPADLVRLVVKACAGHAVIDLNKAIGQLIEVPTLPLGDTKGESEAPVPVPMGRIRGRGDLGDLGVRVKVTMTLENIEHLRDKTDA